jgi:elongation factor G
VPIHRLRLETDRETGQTILRGMGELHLEVTLDRMRTEFDVEGIMGEPQVAYRESVHASRSKSTTSTRSRRVARVSSPKSGSSSSRCERGAGFEFVDETGRRLGADANTSRRSKRASSMQMEDGVLAHFPTVDFQATLVDGSYHDVDSNALTFEIAAKACFREAIRKAGPVLLEPVMKVETVTPAITSATSSATSTVVAARSRTSWSAARNIAVVADVPLSEMFGYIGHLRGMTSRSCVVHDGVLATTIRCRVIVADAVESKPPTSRPLAPN